MWYDFNEREIALLVQAYKQLIHDYGAEDEEEMDLLEKIYETEKQ